MFTIFIVFVALFLIITVNISLEAAEMLLVYLPAVVIIALISWYLINDSRETKNIKYAIIKERIQGNKNKKVNKWSRFGLRGAYPHYIENRRNGIDVLFEVTYNDGKVRTVIAEEGSEKCNELLKYVDKKEHMCAEQTEN